MNEPVMLNAAKSSCALRIVRAFDAGLGLTGKLRE